MTKPFNQLQEGDEDRRKMINEERNKYLRGEGINFSWDEVKKAAADKQLRNELKSNYNTNSQ